MFDGALARGPASARSFSSGSLSVWGARRYDVAQVEREGTQPRLGFQERLDRGRPHAQHLGLDEGGLGAERGVQLLHLLLHPLGLGRPGVLV